jgi:predicted nucleic acid-binding protein
MKDWISWGGNSMRLLFDTSVLVAGFIASHPNHQAALPWLQRAKSKKHSIVMSAHGLAECYAVLTRLPLSPKISPETAQYLLRENIEDIAEIVALSSLDYRAVLKQMIELGLSGGIIYDAITVKAAQKAKVDKILTFNTRDFIRLLPKASDFVVSP